MGGQQRRAVLLTGGWAHPAEVAARGLVPLLTGPFTEVRSVARVDDAAGAITEGCDLLALNACWFRMADARYTDEQRRAHAVAAPEPLRRAVTGHLAAGRPLLALHTAPICFDDWPEWGRFLGATWDWSRSGHPPVGEVPVRVLEHPLSTDLGPFTVTDERYAGLAPTADRAIVAVSDGEDGPQPLVWTRHEGPARVAVDLLGHDERSYEEPTHARLVRRLVSWCLGGSDDA
jgi:uncharacterized protein